MKISENLQQIEQSSKIRFFTRNGLKTQRTCLKRPKCEENAKKIIRTNFKNTVFCSPKLSKIPKCGPFYVQNGEKLENVYESGRYAPPDAKERTCFHRIASLTTLCKAPIVCPWSIFQRYMYLIRAYACVKKALLLADRGWKWQMLYQTHHCNWTHFWQCLQLNGTILREIHISLPVLISFPLTNHRLSYSWQ